jgi:probable HAF family extracellular repeat protein
MCAARTVNSWTRAWGLMLLSIGIFHIFPAQAQQETLTDRAEQGDGRQDHNPKHHHYRFIDLGTLGGPTNYLSVNGGGYRILNDAGIVSSSSDTSITDPNCGNPDCFLAHAYRWQDGVLTDIGALPGLNNSYVGAINARGWSVGYSQNSEIDPITGFREVRAVLWKEDQIVDLGTLGGNWEHFAGYQ